VREEFRKGQHVFASVQGEQLDKIPKIFFLTFSLFQLKTPQEGFEKTKGKHFVKKGEYGFRGEKINEYLKQVL
jgi:hypothetical protein